MRDEIRLGLLEAAGCTVMIAQDAPTAFLSTRTPLPFHHLPGGLKQRAVAR